MYRPVRALAALLLAVAGTGAAHEGETHAAAAAPVAPSGESVRWLGDDELFVPKSLQRLLGVRAAPPPAADDTLELLAEVVADPASRGAVTAPQAGRLEAAGRWPLPGEAVAADQTLAWLRPVLGQREEARRRAELAQIEQSLQIAHINAERLRTQSAAAEGGVTTGNVYREQAELELQLAERRRALETQALGARVALRAVVGGLLASAPRRAGEIVQSGEPLFEIADAQHLYLAAYVDRPDLAARLRTATLLDGDAALPLRLRGQETLAEAPGWRLLFEAGAPPEAPLPPGELRRLHLRLAPAAADAAALGCVPSAGGGQLWTQLAPERFAVRRLRDCAGPAPALRGRPLAAGAALLSQYR